MSSTDWNTIASDLQRAVNNLAWFVLESMAVPEQPVTTPMTSWSITSPTPPPPPPPLQPHVPLDTNGLSLQHRAEPKKEKVRKTNKYKHKSAIGSQVDCLVAETLL